MIWSNGALLTPEMTLIVTTVKDTLNPFYEGAKEIIAAYMHTYGFDYKKARCKQSDFNRKSIG